MKPCWGCRFALLFWLSPSLLAPADMLFREMTAKDTGINWVHVNAQSEHRYLPETIPPGVAIFDYDNDGRMDVLFVNTGESVFFHPAHPRERHFTTTTEMGHSRTLRSARA